MAMLSGLFLAPTKREKLLARFFRLILSPLQQRDSTTWNEHDLVLEMTQRRIIYLCMLWFSTSFFIFTGVQGIHVLFSTQQSWAHHGCSVGKKRRCCTHHQSRSTLVPHARPLCYTFSKKLLFPQYNRQSILTSSRVPLTRKPINVLYSDLQLFIILKNRTQIHCLKRDHW
ncbi:uncharacterized protein LOC124349103 isoform X1 [Daphnia pulicaria]|uniref:uncharacterized protein LOC124349103 isoform X1 n=1 Tax=Daphnia pulicaria TaxID=35523 RepID=UPI001EEB2E2C|nr:uncharacterized protein LOC124349103 isoform X1 [Daphnia pulicaria]